MKKSTKLAYALVLILAAVLCIGLPVLTFFDSADGEETTTVSASGTTETVTTSSDDASGEDETTLSDSDASTVSTVNEVELADYTNITVDAADVEVTDDEIQENIDAALLAYAETVTFDEDGTAVENGDTVNIDFTGSIDEGEFDGGSATDYDLEIGSGTLIDGFEDALIGAEVGETLTIKVTFPDSTTQTTTVDGSDEEIELAGREATFVVTVNYFTRPDLPDYDDDFVTTYYSDKGLSTTEEFEDYLYEQLRQDKIIDAAWEDYVDACTLISLDETEVEDLLDQLLSYYVLYYEEEGSSFEEMVEYYYDMSLTEYTEAYLQPAIEETVKEETVIYALAEAVGIEITDELYDEMTADYMATYGYDTLEDLLDYYSEDDIEFSIYYQQVTLWFVDHVQVVE
ncbi:MAG: FKBP-type peptidyl-prolyl cis-trans isomerase [Lachnospiraceae bacterium]|nr:FKBP-type peptidyl-prolyl cis-trans isomerase [Lachnospiraceae bacterium]